MSRPFFKLVSAALGARKGKVTISLDGTNFTYDFLPASRQSLFLTPDNEEVESSCFANTFRGPLQQVLEGDNENEVFYEEIITTSELKAAQELSSDEEFEPMGELDQQEEVPDVELKPLPKGLKYEFLGENKTYPVIISDELTSEETRQLLAVLRKHKKVIG